MDLGRWSWERIKGSSFQLENSLLHICTLPSYPNLLLSLSRLISSHICIHSLAPYILDLSFPFLSHHVELLSINNSFCTARSFFACVWDQK
jgi:hypothetical protein